MASATSPADVTGLLRQLMASDPGRPRLTWYGPDGERVEFSAKVLDNWVAKTANLLVDELDAGPGSVVAVRLPPHWRTVTWLLAVWSTGACAVTGDAAAAPGADVLVAADRDLLDRAGAAQAVAVALPALATRYGPDLPSGALDAAAGVRSHGDVFVPFVRPEPADPALRTAAGTVTHGGLLAAAIAAADAAGWAEGVRSLTGAAVDDTVAQVLGPLVRGGSVVVHHDLGSLDAAATERLVAQEGITALPG